MLVYHGLYGWDGYRKNSQTVGPFFAKATQGKRSDSLI